MACPAGERALGAGCPWELGAAFARRVLLFRVAFFQMYDAMSSGALWGLSVEDFEDQGAGIRQAVGAAWAHQLLVKVVAACEAPCLPAPLADQLRLLRCFCAELELKREQDQKCPPKCRSQMLLKNGVGSTAVLKRKGW